MRFFVFTALIAAALALVFCQRDLPTYRNLEPVVGYVGMATCQGCHADVHRTFIHTGMGKSWDTASRAKSAATYGEHALVYDSVANFYYQPYWQDSSLYVREFRLEGGDTVHQRRERIQWIVGSGQHTNSHIISRNGYVYQAPVTYYTQDGRWDLAPGFAGDNLRFERLLNAECITCHNHYPKLEPGSLNKFADMPRGIECERCHGPGELHAREKLAGKWVDTARQIDYSIVNPRDLPRDLQMDLCQRCHLQGVAVLREGKDWFDFRPGMSLASVMNVFLPRFTNSHEQFIMASQADRLRQSACYQASDMTCITCHNPHISIEQTGVEQYNRACQGCHREASGGCSAPQAERLAGGNDCSGCHMPKSGSVDIPHVRITDHWISRNNVSSRPTPPSDEPADFLGLQILTKEEGSPLEMARGYLALYDKYLEAPQVLDSAGYYLDRSREGFSEKLPVLVHFHFARQDYAALAELAGQVSDTSAVDAWTAYRLGEGYFRLGQPAEALPWLHRAVSELPRYLDFQEKLSAVLIQNKQYAEARKTLAFVLGEDPRREVALTNLGYLNALDGRYERAEALYDQAIALNPDYVQALLNKAAMRRLQGDAAATRVLLERVLVLEPGHPQALAVLSSL